MCCTGRAGWLGRGWDLNYRVHSAHIEAQRHAQIVCCCSCVAGIERAVLDLGDHPGGYQYLLFRLRMLMCGALRAVAAETDARSRSIASRVA